MPAVLAPAANAAATVCDGALGPGDFDDIVVPRGAHCTLTGFHLLGGIVIEPGGSLEASDGTVDGDIIAVAGDTVSQMSADSVAVDGDVDLESMEHFLFLNGQIAGTVRLTGTGPGSSARFDTAEVGDLAIADVESTRLAHLFVINAVNVFAPGVVGGADLPGVEAFDVVAGGGLAFVAAGDNGLVIVEVSTFDGPMNITGAQLAELTNVRIGGGATLTGTGPGSSATLNQVRAGGDTTVNNVQSMSAEDLTGGGTATFDLRPIVGASLTAQRFEVVDLVLLLGEASSVDWNDGLIFQGLQVNASGPSSSTRLTGIQVGEETTLECTADADCQADLHCLGTDCETVVTCNDSSCGVAETCGAGQTCESNFVCEGGSDCNAGQSCDNAVCETTIRCDASSCLVQKSCGDDPACKTDYQCRGGSLCDFSLRCGSCLLIFQCPAGASCPEVAVECPPGQVCPILGGYEFGPMDCPDHRTSPCNVTIIATPHAFGEPVQLQVSCPGNPPCELSGRLPPVTTH